MVKINKVICISILIFLISSCSKLDVARLNFLSGYIAWKQNDWTKAASKFFKSIDLSEELKDEKIKEKYDEKYPTAQTRKGLERQKVQESLHRTMIFKAARGWANKRVVLFGLDRFKGYLFRQVYTMNQSEFEQYLQEQGVT